jgi:predicted transcriptional regulator
MSKSEEFYALLFEVSNEDRDMILSILSKEKKRVSDLSRELNLTYPEIRRHISRLHNIGLILRDIEGFYHLTPYGETCITLFDEFDFISKQREYFKLSVKKLTKQMNLYGYVLTSTH